MPQLRLRSDCQGLSDGWHCFHNNTAEVCCEDQFLCSWGNFDFNPYPCSEMGTTCNPTTGRCVRPLYEMITFIVLAVIGCAIILTCVICCIRGRRKPKTGLDLEEEKTEETDSSDTDDREALVHV